MGDLIRMPYSEVTATLELLDRMGIKPNDLEVLRKVSSWQQTVTAAVISGDPYLLSLLGLEVLAKKAGFTTTEIAGLARSRREDLLREFHDVLLGRAEIKAIEHLIDCDTNPFVPNNWKVEEHQRSGFFKWDPKQVNLYLSRSQHNGKIIEGNKLRKELASKPVFNANLLDYLLANPHLIPEEWKGKYVFFWGTIYRDPDGNLHVRYLNWNNGRWNWSYNWLDGDWSSNNPAALRASIPAAA